jgi:hypothetical protein
LYLILRLNSNNELNWSELMSSNIVITDTNKRVFSLEDHYRQVLNEKLFFIDIGGQGNLTDAWFGGGLTPALVSTVDRIIFASDTATAVAKGPLSLTRWGLAASGNSTDAWFGGGDRGLSEVVSTVYRIIFASDTATAVAKGPLSLARRQFDASGNSTDAWFGGGGFSPGPTDISTVDRIIFASDTATAVTKGPLSLARRNLAASGNLTDAWFGGGITTVGVSTVDRIIFASDTATAVAKGPLTGEKGNLAASGNSTDAWFGGGYVTSSPALVSTVDRIIFASDTATAVAKGPLSLARRGLEASGNSTDAWFGGGITGPANVSRVDRIIFASDTATAVTKGPLSLARNSLAASS